MLQRSTASANGISSKTEADILTTALPTTYSAGPGPRQIRKHQHCPDSITGLASRPPPPSLADMSLNGRVQPMSFVTPFALSPAHHSNSSPILERSSQHSSSGKHRQDVVVSGVRLRSSQDPQPSLASFDSAIPNRTSNSMTTQLQPRAYSASHTAGRQAQAARTDSQVAGASIEAVRCSLPGL